jgi:O-antigen ligase
MVSGSINNRINLSIGKLIVPMLVILCGLMGFSLLYSAERVIFIFISIAALVIIFIEPFFGMMFYLICLYIRPFEIMPIPSSIPVMKLLAGCILIFWLINIVIHRKRNFVKAPQNILIAAFLVVLMASQRIYIQGILYVFSEFSKIVIIYFLLINLITSEKRLKATIWILILCTTYLAIQGILMSRGITIGSVNTRIEGRVISSGIFADPNDLAMTLVVGIPFIYHFFFLECLVIKRALLLVSGGLILYCILLTGSRGGMLGLAIVMYLLLRNKTGTIIGVFLVLICLVGLLSVAPSSTVERINEASLSEGTGYDRIVHWYDGWRMFLSNPINGIGMNNYPEYARGYVAHNSFVHVAAETGIMGILIWIGLFYFSFKNTLSIESKAGKVEILTSVRKISISIKTSLIGFIVCVFFLSRQYEYIPYILMALSVSVYEIYSKRSEMSSNMNFSVRDILSILAITSGFIVLWYMIIKTFA